MSRKEMQSSRKASKRRTLIRLIKAFSDYKYGVFFVILLTIASNLMVLLGPYLSGKAIDAIGVGQGEADFPLVFRYAFLMFIFYLTSASLSYLITVLMTRISQRVVVDLRTKLFDKMQVLPVSFFDKSQVGDIVSRYQYDIDTINNSLSHDVIQVFTSFVMVVGSLAMMMSISRKLVIVFVVTVPLSLLFMKYKAFKVKPYFRVRSKKQGEYNGVVEELLSGQKTIAAYNVEDWMISSFDNMDRIALDAYNKADYYGCAMGPSMTLINNISLSMISVLGAILYLFGSISIGGLSSFVLYSRKFTGPFNEFANIITEIQSALSAAERVFRMLDSDCEKEDRQGAKDVDNIKGFVDFEHVVFGYDENKLILDDFNLDVRPGQKIAIVGPTGAGKTTIINLLMRFYDPLSGKLEFDRTNMMDITRKSQRSFFAMVLQDPWLFEGTILENIAYGKPNATREEVVRVAKSVGIHEYIMTLPSNYDTVISENGSNISQGQKQMLTIARAMLLDKNMLILDEATSNVDTRTEKLIQAAFDKLMEGRTCFVIAHRLSTVSNADKIIVIQDGCIKESGTHQSLLAEGGIYASMYSSQFD